MEGKKIALITGCSSGIGNALARELHKRDNIKVYASARNIDSIKSLESMGMEIICLDVTVQSSIQNAIDSIIAKEGRIDILVNNAGLNYYCPGVELKDQDARRIMDTNFFGVVNTTNAAAQNMIARRSGLIVNIGSVVGLAATPYTGMYCASKAATHSWSDALRLELAPFNVGVVIVMPGSIQSDIANNATPQLKNHLEGGKSLYEGVKDYIYARSVSSQVGSITAEKFAEYTVNQFLSSHPPRRFAYGPNSFTFLLFQYLPFWLTDFLLSKRFGLTYLKQIVSSRDQSYGGNKSN